MFNQPALCMWGKGLSGESEGLGRDHPQLTQHWFLHDGPEAQAPCAKYHSTPPKLWGDHYEEVRIGDTMALGEAVRDAGAAEDRSLVGVGSFGVVRLAVHKASQTRVAFKIVVRNAAGKSYYDTFVGRDLFGKLLQFRHPNLVSYVDFFVGQNDIAVVMLPLEGEELNDFVLQHTPLTETFVRSIMNQCCSALSYTHEHGVIHRDIKNDSFRFERNNPDDQGRLVLFDFGLSVEVAFPKRLLCGTVPYVAPEISTRKYGTAIDMWSLGVVLCTLFTGDFPFDFNPEGHFTDFVIGKRETQAALLAVDLQRQSTEANTFLAGLLTVDPEERMTADEALEHEWLFGVLTDLPFTSSLSGNAIGVSMEKYIECRDKLKTVVIAAPQDEDGLDTSPGDDGATTLQEDGTPTLMSSFFSMFCGVTGTRRRN